MQKLGIFPKLKSKIPNFERGKSKNYASGLRREQIIPQIDPREIASAFHGAGAEISEEDNFWIETK